MTLVETLAVLAIVGVTSGAAALALPGARTPTVAGEARGLAAAVQAAADAALDGDAPARFVADAGGYRIGDTPRHALPPPMTLAAGAPVALDDAATIAVTIDDGGEAWRVTFDGLTAAAGPVP